MNKSKLTKLMLVAVATVGVFGLTACGTKEKAKEEVKIDKIVIAASNSSVPSSFVENGVHKGFEVELWEAISKETGIPVEYQLGEFSSLFGYLDSGKADTVANLITVTDERKEKYDFSEPYAYIPQKLVVNEDKKDINKIVDINGLACGYVAGSNSGPLFKKLAEDKGITIDLQVFESGAPMITAFNSGKINVLIAAENEAKYRIDAGIFKGRIADETINVATEAYPFAKDNEKSAAINEKVSKAIKTLRDNGTLGELSKKWYSKDYSNEIK
ncbi:MAG: transporter substrate-binding domain-containing protein [Clostridium sp.]